MAVIEFKGPRPGAPVFETNACGQCEYTEASVQMMKRTRGPRKVVSLYRSEEDAAEAYQVVRDQLIKEAWDKAFANFKCKNQQACRNKEACNNDIKYLIAHTEIEEDARKRRRFKVMLTIGREIRCVATAQNEQQPQLFDFREYEGNERVPEDLPPVAASVMKFQDEYLAFNQPTRIMVVDADANKNPNLVEGIAVGLWTEGGDQIVELKCIEIGPNTGVFESGDIRALKDGIMSVGSQMVEFHGLTRGAVIRAHYISVANEHVSSTIVIPKESG